MDIKIFKNKNINIKIENIKEVNKNDFMEYYYNALLDHEFALPFDSGCAGNFDMYDTYYNCYTGGIYIILHSDFKKLMEGKSVKLYYGEPDDEDMEIINNY